jgi:hypothetical protein
MWLRASPYFPVISELVVLLAKISSLDRETLRNVIRRLPDTGELSDEAVDSVILEVARRGIPTVRGLSGGDSGAIGDLGLFVAARLLQDEFRVSDSPSSIFPVWKEIDDVCTINLLIPVDPFQDYLDEISRVLGKAIRSSPLNCICRKTDHGNCMVRREIVSRIVVVGGLVCVNVSGLFVEASSRP